MKLKEKMNGLFTKNKKWILGFIGIFIVATAGIGIYFAAEKMGEMTQEEAEAIVRDDHNGEVLSFAREWEWEFGIPSIIKMAIKTEKSYEEIEMDASSGQILRRETNHLLSSLNNPVLGNPSTSTAPAIIMPEEAIELALDEVTGSVKEIELDEEDHNIIYELEIEEGSREYNVHVDAITGSILMVSTES
jgi:uncharacterized membrane protein YkoI